MLKGLLRLRLSSRPSAFSELSTGSGGNGPKCSHTLREFATPNSYFQCNVCKEQIGVWETMYGCRECNYDECERCHELKLRLRSSQEENNMSQGQASSPVVPAKRSWDCAACTYENELFRTECEMCQSKRPEQEITDGSGRAPASLLCTICCDAPCEVAFMECGHCITCERCSNSLFAMSTKQCPMCRKALSAKPLRIYFA